MEPLRLIHTGFACPVCKKGSLDEIIVQLDLPYLGPAHQTTVMCAACGFRHSDIFILSDHGPVRLEFDIEGVDDLNVRVVRSTSGSVSLPSLGLRVEPGPSSEAYVTNVEGVIQRFVDVIQMAHRFALGDGESIPGAIDRAVRLMSRIEDLLEGRERATLVIEDPLGNSAILSDRTRKRPLTPDEVARLPIGAFTVDWSG